MQREHPEALIQHTILAAWGAHPRLRIARVNVGVGWFAKGRPARKSDAGAYPVKFGVRGTADIVGIIAPTGRMLMIEVKAEGGTQRPEQVAMERMITKFGGVYMVVRSLAEADAAFATLGVYR